MTVRGDVKLEVGDRPTVAAAAPGSTVFGSFRLLQVLILGLTIAGVVIGLRITVPGGIAPVTAVAFGLTLAWALVGFVDTRARERTGSKVSPFHLLAGVDAFVAAVALTAGRKADTVHASGGARGHRDHGRHRRDGDLVPLPPGPAGRAPARFHAACRRRDRLRRCGRRRVGARRGASSLHHRGRGHQLGHRGCPRRRTDASSLHRDPSATTASGWSGSASE